MLVGKQVHRFYSTSPALTIVLQRHGDRSPVRNYYEGDEKRSAKERDLWEKLVFEEPVLSPLMSENPRVLDEHGCFGQLTQKGVQQCFNLGTLVAKRHAAIPPSKVLARSSNYTRTLLSLQHFLRGLFKEDMSKVLQVPIHIHHDEKDSLNAYHSDASFREVVSERLSQPDILKGEQSVTDLIELFNEELPWFRSNPPFFWIYAADFLVTRSVYADAMPTPEALLKVRDRVFSHLDSVFRKLYGTPKLLSKACGPVLGQIVNHMKDTIRGDADAPTLVVLSAHDVTLLPVLEFVGGWHPSVWPPYAASIIFDLHSTEKGWIVRPFYNFAGIPEPAKTGMLSPCDAHFDVFHAHATTKSDSSIPFEQFEKDILALQDQ